MPDVDEAVNRILPPTAAGAAAGAADGAGGAAGAGAAPQPRPCCWQVGLGWVRSS